MNLTTIPAFTRDDALHVVIESPRGCSVKLKYDSRLESMTLSRPLTDGLMYPYDWGFIPSTLAADGDPVDAIVVWDRSSYPGVVLSCRLLGVLSAEQNSKHNIGTRERNDRIVAVPIESAHQSATTSVADLPEQIRKEIEVFLAASTAFEHKDLKFLGWQGVDVAKRLIESSRPN